MTPRTVERVDQLHQRIIMLQAEYGRLVADAARDLNQLLAQIEEAQADLNAFILDHAIDGPGA